VHLAVGGVDFTVPQLDLGGPQLAQHASSRAFVLLPTACLDTPARPAAGALVQQQQQQQQQQQRQTRARAAPGGSPLRGGQGGGAGASSWACRPPHALSVALRWCPASQTSTHTCTTPWPHLPGTPAPNLNDKAGTMRLWIGRAPDLDAFGDSVSSCTCGWVVVMHGSDGLTGGLCGAGAGGLGLGGWGWGGSSSLRLPAPPPAAGEPAPVHLCTCAHAQPAALR
jgi:hypothetical protein